MAFWEQKMTIFRDNAPAHWNAGLPVIPLISGQKRPAIPRWQLFSDKMPNADEQRVWLETFPDGNMGLPMGPASGLVAIDIDTDDQKVLGVLDRILPKTPWTRVGKKGMVRIYKFDGERTNRIKNGDDGSMICEILSKGTQIVLPPSIHPDTGRPYVANAPLYDVIHAVPRLPMNIEDLIRSALADIGINVSVGGGGGKTVAFVPAGARDNQMVYMAGLFARAVLRGERSLLDVLGEMNAWVSNFVEKVIGDELSVEKAQAKVVEFLVRDVTGERRAALPIGWDEGLSPEDKEKLGLTFTQDDEKWSVDKILDHLTAEFERFPDQNSPGRMTAVDVALDRIARAEGSMSVLDEERVLRFIQQNSANTLTVGTLRKQMATLRRGDIAGESHQEIAAAVVKYVSKYGELRHFAGQFWQWKGACWERVEESFLQKIIATEYGAYPACKRYSDYQGVMKVMMSEVFKELKQDPISGLNFANGFLTEDLDLIPHNPDHGMTYVLPYRYMPELAGHMPIFQQYLNDSWSEDADYMDKMAALQEAIGASLFQNAPVYQRAFCLFGQPGSGKSVMSTIVRGLCPDNSVSSIAPHDWADKFLPIQMYGKVINFAGELSENKFIPGDIFKQIVEGEAITGQNKNEDPFQFRPLCAQWFNSNHLPKTKDSSDGFNRRWLILEWNKRVPTDKQVPELANIILEYEKEALVAWAVEGFRRLKKNRNYTLPTSHMACIDQMATDNNSVRYFLTVSPRVLIDRTDKENPPSTSATALHGEYWSFCIGIGTAQRVSMQSFLRMMRELQPVFGFEEIHKANSNGSQEVIYLYIRLGK
jgi:putative DNA primase/helicase